MSLNKFLNNRSANYDLKATFTEVTAPVVFVENIQHPTLGEAVCSKNQCVEEQLLVEGDIIIKTGDMNEINLKPPTVGTINQVLSSNGDGTVEFKTIVVPEVDLTNLNSKTQNIRLEDTVEGTTVFNGNLKSDTLYMKTVDMNEIQLKTADLGQPGYSLKTDSMGGVYWAPDNYIGPGGMTYAGSSGSASNKLVYFNSNDGLTTKDGNIGVDGVNLDMSNGLIRNVGAPQLSSDAVDYGTVSNIQNALQSNIDNINLQSAYDSNNLILIDNLAFKPLILKSTDDTRDTDEVQLKVENTMGNTVFRLRRDGSIVSESDIVCTAVNGVDIKLNGGITSEMDVQGVPKIINDSSSTQITNTNVTVSADVITESSNNEYNVSVAVATGKIEEKINGITKNLITNTGTNVSNNTIFISSTAGALTLSSSDDTYHATGNSHQFHAGPNFGILQIYPTVVIATKPLSLGTNKIVNMGDGQDPQDAVTVSQVSTVTTGIQNNVSTLQQTTSTLSVDDNSDITSIIDTTVSLTGNNQIGVYSGASSIVLDSNTNSTIVNTGSVSINSVVQDTKRTSHISYAKQNWTNTVANYTIPNTGAFTILDWSIGGTPYNSVPAKNISLVNNTNFVVSDAGLYRVLFSFNLHPTAGGEFSIRCVKVSTGETLSQKVHETLNDVGIESTINTIVQLGVGDSIRFEYGGATVANTLIDKEIHIMMERIFDQ